MGVSKNISRNDFLVIYKEYFKQYKQSKIINPELKQILSIIAREIKISELNILNKNHENRNKA